MMNLEKMRFLIGQIAPNARDRAIEAGSRFIEDLGMQSLEMVSLVFLFEEEFGVDLVESGTSLADVRTVGDAMALIGSLSCNKADMAG